MEIFQSKCDNCEDRAYIFPDQVEEIKKDPRLKLHKYCKEKLYVGKKWFCIRCDASGKSGNNCKISERMPSDKAEKLLKIRKRETKIELSGKRLKSMGFVLP